MGEGGLLTGCPGVIQSSARCELHSIVTPSLQMGKLRHRVEHLGIGGVQRLKLSLLLLTGCSWDLSLNIKDPKDREKKKKDMPLAFSGRALSQMWRGAGLVLGWVSWAGASPGQLGVLLGEHWRPCWLRYFLPSGA